MTGSPPQTASPPTLLPINIIASYPSLSLLLWHTHQVFLLIFTLIKARTLLLCSSDWPPRRHWRSSVWSIWRHMFCPCDHQTVSLRTLPGPEGLGLREHTNTKYEQLRQHITVRKINTKPMKPLQAKKHKCLCLGEKNKNRNFKEIRQSISYFFVNLTDTHKRIHTHLAQFQQMTQIL